MDRIERYMKKITVGCLTFVLCLLMLPPISVKAQLNGVSNESELQMTINNAVDGKLTEISIEADFTITSKINIPNKKNILITSSKEDHTITAKGTDSLFNLESGSSLILGDSGFRVILDGDQKTTTYIISCDSESILTLNNATIKNSNGGAIGMDNTDGDGSALITVNSGSILEDNLNTKNGGGAIYAKNATVAINGGIFRNNSSSYSFGGAIYVVGAVRGSIVVNDGLFIGNFTTGENYAWGGGAIAIATKAEESYIRGGIFENNSADGEAGIGGAVYIDNGGLLTMTNAVITNNNTQGNGGGIWYCDAGGGLHFDEYSVLIDGNNASNGRDFSIQGSSTSSRSVKLSNTVLGGGSVQWYNENTGAVQTNLNLDGKSGVVFTVNAIESGTPTVMEKALNNAKVIIRNNSSSLAGGGIACNGICTFGIENPISKTVTKTWTGTNNPSYKISVQLYKNGIPFDTAVELNSTNNWKYTWSDLIDDNSDYTVKEVSINDVSITGNSYALDDGDYLGTIDITVIDDDMGNEFSITNNFIETIILKGDVTLKANKVLTGRTLKDKEFSFSLYSADSNYNYSDSTLVETVMNSLDGTISFSKISYAEGDIGKHYYVIKEVSGSEGTISYSEKVVKVLVNVEKESDTSLKVTATYDGVDTIPLFTNTYTPKSTSATIEALKTLTGKMLLDNAFTFELYSANSNYEVINTMPIKTTQNLADGSIIFSSITYTEANTYFYVIKERNGNVAGFTYDTSSMYVKVIVTDVDGELEAAITYVNSTNALPTFVNSYTPLPTEVTLRANKILMGRALQNQEFEFGLYSTNNNYVYNDANLIEKVKNNLDGSIVFDDIEYTVNDIGTHYYVIKELPTNNGTITFSDMEVKIKIEVTKDATDNLNTTVSYDSSATIPTFTNVYSAPEITTSAIDKETGSKILKADNSITIVDTITYENLTIGTTYEVRGILMDKSKNAPLLVNGKTVEQVKTFVPTSSNGTVDVEFTFDGSKLPRMDIVVFEEVYDNNVLIVSHKDINDLAQTVSLDVITTPDTGVNDKLGVFGMLLILGAMSIVIIGKRRKI